MSYQKNWPTWLAYSAAVVAFLVVAVYAVMYATGYRLDFKDWTVRKTGILAITTKPTGATVYIDGRKYSRRTPLTLRNMLPGNYEVKIALQDYRMFKKQVEILSSQVAEEHNIDLVLEHPPTKVLAEDINKLMEVGNEIVYFSKEKQFVKLTGDSPTPIEFDRLPETVKNVLKNVSALSFAKQSEGKTWALGVTASGRRWLVIANFQEGYRGQLFGSPLNQATAEQFSWIDNDRFMVVNGTTIQLADINLNKIITYTKTALGASYQDGKLYYVVRGANGTMSLMRDANPFDDRPAEAWLTDLPVAARYDLTAINDDRLILTTITSAKVRGLWLREVTRAVDKSNPRWTKVASNVGGVWYEHHNLKPKLFYVTGKSLMLQDLAKSIEKPLRGFNTPVELLGKRGETLFLQSNNILYATDADGANLYELMNVTKQTVWLNSDAKKFWVTNGATITEWTLRQDSGLFGALSGLWPAPAQASTAEESLAVSAS